jgi:hypothetical protein
VDWVNYIRTIKEKIHDKSIFQAWQIINSKTFDFHETLIHPRKMKEETLRELIPRNLKITDILQMLPTKQKKIANV